VEAQSFAEKDIEHGHVMLCVGGVESGFIVCADWPLVSDGGGSGGRRRSKHSAQARVPGRVAREIEGIAERVAGGFGGGEEHAAELANTCGIAQRRSAMLNVASTEACERQGVAARSTVASDVVLEVFRGGLCLVMLALSFTGGKSWDKKSLEI
jgi:hypothetical protein